MRRAAVVLLAAALRSAAMPQAAVPQTARQARVTAAAREAFDRFLRGSLEQPQWVRNDTLLDGVMNPDCGGGGGEYRSYWIASYRIQDVPLRGAQTTGVVEVVSAAEQGPDPHGIYPTRVTLDVRRHVLRFPMRRDAGTGRWLVCPVSESGFALGHDIIPHNLGMDPEVVFAVVDSIRGVPHRRWYHLPE